MRGFPLVLCYHGVTAAWRSGLAVTPSDFERQLRGLLWAGYRPVSAEQAVERRGRFFHVTFDDAYRSVETIALPILERLGVPCSVFACSAYADTGSALAVPELEREVELFPDALETLDWDGLRRLQGRGVSIGSHTVTHPHLPQLGDDELDRELRDSRMRIEDELGRPCVAVAYPYGHEDARVHRAARRAGYDVGWALPGSRGPLEPLALPRVGVYLRDGVARFAFKVLRTVT